jgi:hypothetical protein
MGPRITLNSTLTTGPFILLFGSSASQPISSPLMPQLNLKESTVFSFIRSAFFCTDLDNNLFPKLITYLLHTSWIFFLIISVWIKTSCRIKGKCSRFEAKTQAIGPTVCVVLVVWIKSTLLSPIKKQRKVSVVNPM